MLKVNENFAKMQSNYLFAEIAKRRAAYQEQNPGRDVISLGIGDVTRPLCPAVVEAMHRAVDEMGTEKGFHGYAPDGGYPFLRDAIRQNDYEARGVSIDSSEIFVSDGAKSDTANIGDIVSVHNKVAVGDPVYPVYVDTNVMAGRGGELVNGRWSNIYYMPCTEENGFIPSLPAEKVDIIYLCFPNNPTGAMATREQLKAWVDYARENGSVILYDAAYEAFITGDLPHSIYEIEGAKECAIEFKSFSKTAGFTGTRCAYTVVPKELVRDGVSLHSLWARRTGTKFNGAPYIIQRGAAAVYSEEGRRQVRETIGFYLENARIIKQGLRDAGFTVYGGENAPYIWMKTPDGLSSWDMFDRLLKDANVVGTPGSGFGPSGEGFFRLTAFGSRENTERAIERIKSVL